MELIKRILVYFFDLVIHPSSAIAYQNRQIRISVIKITLSKYAKAHDIRIKVT